MATCWNCGARVNGPACQMCGAAQSADTAQPPPYGQSGPVMRQASRSVRPTPGSGYYGPGGRLGSMPGGPPDYIPSGQPDMGGYPQRGPYQQAGMPGSGGYPQPGYGAGRPYQYQSSGAPPYVPGGPPPAALPNQMMWAQSNVPAMQPVTRGQPRGSEALAVPLALLGGLAGGVIGAAVWAFILDLTRINFVYLAFVLGIVVGLGVALGARGHNDIGLSLFAGVLGLFSFFLALYFRLSLGYAHALGESTNLFALSLNDFANKLGDYMALNPINYLNFVLVPLAAMGTAYRYITRGRR